MSNKRECLKEVSGKINELKFVNTCPPQSLTPKTVFIDPDKIESIFQSADGVTLAIKLKPGHTWTKM